MTDFVITPEKNKIHPHKFTLWVAIASILMMFAGLTSAYIIKGSLPGWSTIEFPVHFYYSTAAILLSSLTVQWALKSFKERNMRQYRLLLSITAALGLLFVLLQWIGFNYMFERGVTWSGSAGAGQFLYIIFGLHALHILGGVVALFTILFRAYSSRIRNYNAVPVEIVSTYWHFVDVLWLYLLVFFMITI